MKKKYKNEAARRAAANERRRAKRKEDAFIGVTVTHAREDDEIGATVTREQLRDPDYCRNMAGTGFHTITDPVRAPAHYTRLSPQPLDVVEEWELDLHSGNAVEYIARHMHKGQPIQDLEKAIYMLQRRVARLKKKAAVGRVRVDIGA